MNDSLKEKEFEKVIISFGTLIAKICYYFSADKDEFNDLRQEVFYNIWKGWDKFKEESKISTWIYRIAFNTCVSYQRKQKNSRNVISLDQIVEIPMEEEVSKLMKYNVMHRLIQQLPYEERAIILMWLDEKPYEEIAELMGVNRNTLAVKLKRIKEKLVKLSKINGL